MATKKKPNLAAALAEQTVSESSTAPAIAPSNDRPRRPSPNRASREGQVNIAAWFPIAVKFQLDELRLQVGRERGRKVTLGELQAEAYNDLFKKYGMAEIAPGTNE